MINKSDLKIILISFAVILSADWIFAAVHTVLHFSNIELAAPFSAYLLYGYSPLAITGFYMGWTKTKTNTRICILVSLVYVLKRFLFDGLFVSDLRHNYLQYEFMIVLNLTALSFFIILGANALSQQIKKIKSTQPSAAPDAQKTARP